MPVVATIQLRRGTAGLWAWVNPVLAEGEEGLETDTGKRKVGDGSTAWSSLTYNVDPSSEPGSNASLIAWSLAQAFATTGSQVFDSTYGTLTSANIQWPDGVTGTYSAATLDTTSTNPGGATQFVATYVGSMGTKTVTVTIPRDGNGNISGDMTAVVT